MKPWSYSSLKHFEQCAKSYYSQRVAKTHKQDDTAEYLTWGNKVHKELEDRINIKTPLPSYLEHLEPVIAAFEATGKMLVAELEFAFTKDWKPTGYWSDDCWTRGKVDVMLIGKDDAIILDWKTGKRRPDFGQLEYYALALGIIGIKKIKGFFAWIKTKEFDSTYIDENIIRHVKELFTSKAARLERAYDLNEWPAKTSALCAYCPVVYDCEEAREKKYHLKAKHIRKARTT
jgi:hypothetical protein